MIEKELVLQLREINQKAASIMQQKFDDHELTIGLLHIINNHNEQTKYYPEGTG